MLYGETAHCVACYLHKYVSLVVLCDARSLYKDRTKESPVMHVHDNGSLLLNNLPICIFCTLTYTEGGHTLILKITPGMCSHSDI